MDRHVSTSQGEVIREDLLNLLAQSESVPLTLLLAPPGSGKSTLLKHWQQRPGRYAKVYVPVPLREAHPDCFLHRLTEAVAARFATFDLAWPDRLDEGIRAFRSRWVSNWLARWSDSMSGDKRPVSRCPGDLLRSMGPHGPRLADY